MVLSFINLGLDELDTARTWIETAISETREAGYVARWPLIFDVGASLALHQHRPLEALRLAAGSAARRKKLGGGAPTFFTNMEQVISDARAAAVEVADAQAADAAWAEGERLDDEALTALIRA
jgi:hypothetical protein